MPTLVPHAHLTRDLWAVTRERPARTHPSGSAATLRDATPRDAIVLLLSGLLSACQGLPWEGRFRGQVVDLGPGPDNEELRGEVPAPSEPVPLIGWQAQSREALAALDDSDPTVVDVAVVPYLTTREGYALYIDLRDANNTAAPACKGEASGESPACARQWQPMLVSASCAPTLFPPFQAIERAATDLEAAAAAATTGGSAEPLVSADLRHQLTFEGHPLYTWRGLELGGGDLPSTATEQGTHDGHLRDGHWHLALLRTEGQLYVGNLSDACGELLSYGLIHYLSDRDGHPLYASSQPQAASSQSPEAAEHWQPATSEAPLRECEPLATTAEKSQGQDAAAVPAPVLLKEPLSRTLYGLAGSAEAVFARHQGLYRYRLSSDPAVPAPILQVDASGAPVTAGTAPYWSFIPTTAATEASLSEQANCAAADVN